MAAYIARSQAKKPPRREAKALTTGMEAELEPPWQEWPEAVSPPSKAGEQV